MNKIVLLLCGVCTAFIYSSACKAQQRLADDHNRSLLWEISGKGMKKPSFLFGTMHMICKDDYIWTSKMAKALKMADEVCFEMDMDDPKVLLEIGKGMIDESGKKLSDYFNEADYQLVEKYFHDSLGLNAFMISQLKPGALISLLTSSTMKCNDMVSYETNIMQQALEQNKTITGLETPEEQIKLLDALPADSIIAELLNFLKGEPIAQDALYDSLLAAYKQQNLPELHQLMSTAGNNYMNLNSFIDNRNEKWIERMEGRMEQQSVFFAVGAGHLWGKNGVINLLRLNGYKVLPIK